MTMEGTNSAGKRVSLLNDDSSDGFSASSSGSAHARLPYHPKAAAGLPRPTAPAAGRPSYSSRSASSITPTTTPATAASFGRSHSYTTKPKHSSHHSYSSDTDNSSSSRHSSVASSHHSPAARAVPQLLRHDSTTSSQSLNTPSPMTPTYPYEPLDPQGKVMINIDPANYPFAQQPVSNAATQHPQHRGMAGAASSAPYYPSPPQGSIPVTSQALYSGFPSMQQNPLDDAYDFAAAPAVQFQYATNLIEPITPTTNLVGTALASPTVPAATPTSSHPAVDQSTPTATGNSSSAQSSTVKPAKKKYPCPHAARFNCSDTFTTSGHAARHGKKHTGEKNILCPTCHKAFTRKDNMKQHERTHKNRKDHDGTDAKSIGNSRRTQSISSVAPSTMTHKSSNSTEMDLDSPVIDGMDDHKRNNFQRPSLSRPSQYSGSGSSNVSNEIKLESLHQRPELNRQFSGESQDGEGESPGLDALAMAATSELR